MARGGNRKWPRWTAEEESLLRKLERQGVRKVEIGIALNRSRSAIYEKLSYNNKPRKVGAQPGSRAGKHHSRKDLSKPSDRLEESKFIRECAVSNELYCQAVEREGGGSWGGHLSSVDFNPAGTRR